MDITSMLPQTEAVYNDPAFLTMLESFLTVFRQSNSLSLKAVTPLQQGKYLGDFYGLLQDLGVASKYHWLIMRINGYVHPGDYQGQALTVMVPDLSQIEMLKGIFKTKKA